MIRKANGTPFKVSGSYQQFDPTSPKHDLFNRFDSEAIKLGGSPIYYYKVLIQTQTVDPIYFEDRGKLFDNNYVELFSYYEPPQQQNLSTLFAVDVPEEEIIFELNYQDVLTRLGGEPPLVGSRIYTPHRGENWIIIDRRLDQFKYWGIVRLNLQCRKFPENRTSNEGTVTGFVPTSAPIPK